MCQFQFLIGTIQTIVSSHDYKMLMPGFNSLQVRYKLLELLLGGWESRPFQFLIGTIQTDSRKKHRKQTRYRFNSLQVRYKRKHGKRFNRQEKVSIPYRYDTNAQRDACCGGACGVSIPYRYDTNTRVCQSTLRV